MVYEFLPIPLREPPHDLDKAYLIHALLKYQWHPTQPLTDGNLYEHLP
jgi:hypothetical protein